MSLLQMSFAGAVMILAITIIRALAISLLPKKTFLALWGIAVARLLLPFSLLFFFMQKTAYDIQPRARHSC